MIKQTNQKGYTMIETILYLSLLIILGGVLAGYANNAFKRYKIGRTTQQVLELKKAILHYTAVNDDYTKLDIDKMIEEKALPLDMQSKRHALGGKIEIGPVSTMEGATENDNYRYLFYIRFENLFRGACAEILTQGQFYGDGSDLDALIINDKYAWKYKNSYYDTTGTQVNELSSSDTPSLMSSPNIRLDVSQALNACEKKKDNSILWIFS